MSTVIYECIPNLKYLRNLNKYSFQMIFLYLFQKVRLTLEDVIEPEIK